MRLGALDGEALTRHGQAMADGSIPAPGGWNRFALEVEALDEMVAALRAGGEPIRNDIVRGGGGEPIQLDYA